MVLHQALIPSDAFLISFKLNLIQRDNIKKFCSFYGNLYGTSIATMFILHIMQTLDEIRLNIFFKFLIELDGT